MINYIGYTKQFTLTNIVSGHHTDGSMDTEEIELRYGAEKLSEADISHNLLVIKINEFTTDKLSIYDRVRGHWKINLKNAMRADYLLAVYHGLVIGEYENMVWYPSNIATEFYPRLNEENLALTNRKYCTCTATKQPIYKGKDIGSIVKDTQNPISYIWGRSQKEH